MVNFTAAKAVNILALTELDILSDFNDLDFSDSGFDGFTAGRGQISLRVIGDGFLYNPFDGHPFTGEVEQLRVRNGGIFQYEFTNTSVDVDNIEEFTAITSLLDGADVLNGSGFNDTLFGFAGNDRVFGKNADDVVGGNAGNDLINGGRGADRMSGGPGDDTFVFNSTINAGDQVTDFRVGHDLVQLANNIFVGIGSEGPLDPDIFHVGSQATTPEQRIIYDPNAGGNFGVLYYDSNGSNPGGQQQFAKLNGHPQLSADDIFVI